MIKKKRKNEDEVRNIQKSVRMKRTEFKQLENINMSLTDLMLYGVKVIEENNLTKDKKDKECKSYQRTFFMNLEEEQKLNKIRKDTDFALIDILEIAINNLKNN